MFAELLFDDFREQRAEGNPVEVVRRTRGQHHVHEGEIRVTRKEKTF